MGPRMVSVYCIADGKSATRSYPASACERSARETGNEAAIPEAEKAFARFVAVT